MPDIFELHKDMKSRLNPYVNERKDKQEKLREEIADLMSEINKEEAGILNKIKDKRKESIDADTKVDFLHFSIEIEVPCRNSIMLKRKQNEFDRLETEILIRTDEYNKIFKEAIQNKKYGTGKLYIYIDTKDDSSSIDEEPEKTFKLVRLIINEDSLVVDPESYSFDNFQKRHFFTDTILHAVSIIELSIGEITDQEINSLVSRFLNNRFEAIYWETAKDYFSNLSEELYIRFKNEFKNQECNLNVLKFKKRIN